MTALLVTVIWQYFPVICKSHRNIFEKSIKWLAAIYFLMRKLVSTNNFLKFSCYTDCNYNYIFQVMS